MSNQSKTSAALWIWSVICFALAAMFLFNPGGRATSLPAIPLVDTNYLDTSTVRRSYADLVKAGEDVSDFDCYTCHEKGKPVPIHLDEAGGIIVAKEHADVVMDHGSHGRNNNCFNCHEENNLALMQTRDGRKVSFGESPLLCGSCHGPTYRDWEAGVHGRTSGYWNRTMGAIDRKQCVNCHDPHAPKFPGRHPAPGPHSLHPSFAAHTGAPEAVSARPTPVPAKNHPAETATNRTEQPAH